MITGVPGGTFTLRESLHVQMWLRQDHGRKSCPKGGFTAVPCGEHLTC